MNNPKISIVTIAYNSAATIEETIQSVVGQSYDNVEYIIVDGGSTDDTLAIVERYKDRVARLVSEPDNGISDAFNKGIGLCTGDVIGIINSDDVLLPGALRQLAEAFDGETDVYRANTIIWNPDTGFKGREIPSMKFPTIPLIIHNAHQSTFVTPQAYRRYGTFDTTFRYFMDLDLLTRFYKAGAKMKQLDFDAAMFRIGGVTFTPIWKKKDEMKRMVRKNGGSWLQSNVYYWGMFVQELIKRTLNVIFGDDFKRKIRYRK